MINKNISVWRGDLTPPTSYHLWQKEDGSLCINTDNTWKPIASIANKDLLDATKTDVDKLKLLSLVEVLPSNDNTYKSYLLKSGESTYGSTIDIPKDRFIKYVELGYDNATIDESNGQINIGTGDRKNYILFSVILSDGSYLLLKVNLSSFISSHDYLDGLELKDNAVKVKVDVTSEKYLSTTLNGVKISGVDNAIKDSVEQVKNAILNGEWLNIKNGSGGNSIAEGAGHTVSGYYAHAEGRLNTASGTSSHVEGQGTSATDAYAHAEGWHTLAMGNSSHAEGYETAAKGIGSHAEGGGSEAVGLRSHAEGSEVYANGSASHAEGALTQANGDISHAEGDGTIAYGARSHAEGFWSVTGNKDKLNDTEVGRCAHAEGYKTLAEATRSHAEGSLTQSLGYASHAEGLRTVARGYRSHTEGQDTCILSTGGHAQGMANYHTNDLSVIHDVGIGTVVDNETETPESITRLSAETILHTEDEKNGYKYLIGVGGYKGQEIGDSKSVQEVISGINTDINTLKTDTSTNKTLVYSINTNAIKSIKATLTDSSVSLQPTTLKGVAQSEITINKASTTASGVMSAEDKTKLDGIETGANKYTLPVANSSTLGGVKAKTGTKGTNDASVLINSDNTLYVPQASASSSGVINKDKYSVLDNLQNYGFAYKLDLSVGNYFYILIVRNYLYNIVIIDDISSSNVDYASFMCVDGGQSEYCKLRTFNNNTTKIDLEVEDYDPGYGLEIYAKIYLNNFSNGVLIYSNILIKPTSLLDFNTSCILSASPIDFSTFALKTEIPKTLPASDVSAWAKASTKPTYTKAEVGLGNVDNTADANKEVLSATKLKTARTLWGNSFDGNANITGDLKNIGTTGNSKLSIEGVIASVDYTHIYTNENKRPIVFLKDAGNVGIGIEAPTEKLQVNGNMKADSYKLTDGTEYAEPCTDEEINALFS